MKRATWAIFACLAAAALAARGQSVPAGRDATGRNGAAPSPSAPAPRNLDKTLQDLVALDASQMPAGDFVAALQKLTRTNIAVNWPALAAAGITRDTPITLHVKDVSYEAVVKALIEMLPAEKAGGANYDVGDNILEITTNAELGKEPEFHLRDVGHAISYSLTAGTAPAEEKLQNAATLQQILAAEMRRAGEPPDAKHLLSIKDGALAASVSDRGLSVIDRALADFNQPVKLGQLAAGTQLTAQAKTAAAALNAAGVTPADYAAIARDPDKYAGKISFALLPGTADELGKDKPQVEGAITDGGILLLGPPAALRRRTLLAVYDLRDVIKKIAAKNKLKPAPAPDAIESAVVGILQATLKPDGDGTWADAAALAKDPRASALIPAYGGLLVVFATPATHRAVAAALQDMAK